MTPQQAQLILKVRDALARNDGQDAYHWLYQFADTTCKDHLTPWDSIETTAANQPSPAQPLTTDEDAARQWWNDQAHLTSGGKQYIAAFLAGCTHVRSQQPCKHDGLITTDDTGLHRCYNCLMTWRGQKPQPVDAVATANNPHWLYTQWCEIWEQAHNNNRSDFHKLMRKNYALFSGSQASNQREERETKK